jgi:hypothetical protein
MSGARYVFCQYCDDIRDETGGKVSLMGIYQGGMTITGTVPHVLPKLVISANIATPTSAPFEDLRIEVLHGELSIQSIEIPEDDLKNGFAAHKDGNTMFAMQMIMVLQPLVVPTSGKLFVRVHTGGTALDSNPLHIQVMNSPPLQASTH